MSVTEDRDKKVRVELESWYNKAQDPNIIIDDSEYKIPLEILFSTSVWGFREILLVVVVGMKLYSGFRASTRLYDCNPRAIFEGPIKEFLCEKNIPHRKSGPLNIAKATVGLNKTWAAQRRPSDVAEEVVNIINYLESSKGNAWQKEENVGISLMRKFIECSSRLAFLTVSIEPAADPDFLYKLCKAMIDTVPDAGNTPQKIAAFLLKNYHQYLNTRVVVTGEEDGASVTSTTSKKPGDVNEESTDGRIFKVYEITVKPFNLPRIRDSQDCIAIYNQRHQDADVHEVVVICRRSDCPEGMKRSGLHGYLGSYIYGAVQYYFWDVYEWIANMFQRMTSKGRMAFYKDFNDYVNEVNTSEAVKKIWKLLHSNGGR
ncbi:MAG: hypothetical protein SPD11_00235 [Sphaerochaetaceae bacterium]|nr:hypothetical protein [Sphaerochaetaceae bacterium]